MHTARCGSLSRRCQSSPDWLNCASKRRILFARPLMSTFHFESVQLLELAEADKPNIDVQDGQLVLTAQRQGQKIRITAPLQQVLPVPKQTTVSMLRYSRRGISITGGEKRQGELNKMSKLTDNSVREIRLMISDVNFVSSFRSRHKMYTELAKAYNVHYGTIANVVENKSWKHVKI